MSVAAGPLGRNVEGTGTLSSKGGVSAMYSYSRTKGLFGGQSTCWFEEREEVGRGRGGPGGEGRLLRVLKQV